MKSGFYVISLESEKELVVSEQFLTESEAVEQAQRFIREGHFISGEIIVAKIIPIVAFETIIAHRYLA